MYQSKVIVLWSIIIFLKYIQHSVLENRNHSRLHHCYSAWKAIKTGFMWALFKKNYIFLSNKLCQIVTERPRKIKPVWTITRHLEIDYIWNSKHQKQGRKNKHFLWNKLYQDRAVAAYRDLEINLSYCLLDGWDVTCASLTWHLALIREVLINSFACSPLSKLPKWTQSFAILNTAPSVKSGPQKEYPSLQ